MKQEIIQARLLAKQEKEAAKLLAKQEKAAAKLLASAEKKIAQAAARVAARQARIDSRNAAYAAAQQKKIDDFKSTLSAEDFADLMHGLKPTGARHEHMDSMNLIPTWPNEFTESLARQYRFSGFLSPNQVAPILRGVRRERERAAKAATWTQHQEGDRVDVFCYIKDIVRDRSDDGTYFWRIKMEDVKGKPYQFKTTAVKIHTIADQAKTEQIPVMVDATVKWISPDKYITVLSARGIRFETLM